MKDQILQSTQDAILISKLRAKLTEAEAALCDVTSILDRVYGDLAGHDFAWEKRFPKAFALQHWFYRQHEYDGPCEDKIL